MSAAPSKPEILVAMQAALTAALATKEPWGNLWATGSLAASVWLAREAEDGSDALYRALDEGRGVARVALYGTRGMAIVEVLEELFSTWWGHRIEAERAPTCTCGSSLCQECVRRDRWAQGEALAARAR